MFSDFHKNFGKMTNKDKILNFCIINLPLKKDPEGHLGVEQTFVSFIIG